ncbi:uncharacterized protein LTR77_003707 [Saxophila tyrrhenica]|uniref:F-box domain-containing protein n=1 Tax=Saxophila tyrrhenica TaxID=1690608 RepID=A0AAV9PEU7_9PEZI|nr:hypothetical protein LTR77_003707 [Saxophila tyrrhenica]
MSATRKAPAVTVDQVMATVMPSGFDFLANIPAEISEQIASNLDAQDLMSFRLASNSAATMGYRTLRDSISEEIDFRDHEDLTADQFFNHLVLGLQEGLPDAAAKVKELSMVDTSSAAFALVTTPSITALRLPGLKMLELRNLAITAPSLMALLRHHRHTLRGLVLQDIYLVGSGGMGAAKSRQQWSMVARFIQKHMHLRTVRIDYMKWFDFEKNDWAGNNDYVKFERAKYHRRCYGQSGQFNMYWNLSNGGVFSMGAEATRDGIDAFIKEIAKPVKARRPLPGYQHSTLAVLAAT